MTHVRNIDSVPNWNTLLARREKPFVKTRKSVHYVRQVAVFVHSNLSPVSLKILFPLVIPFYYWFVNENIASLWAHFVSVNCVQLCSDSNDCQDLFPIYCTMTITDKSRHLCDHPLAYQKCGKSCNKCHLTKEMTKKCEDLNPSCGQMNDKCVTEAWVAEVCPKTCNLCSVNWV